MVVPASKENNPLVRGSLVVAGGVLAHFILGTMYCWGNFLSYVPASMLFFDGLAHPGMTPEAVQVMPFALIALNIGMPVGARLNKELGPRLTTMLGCALMVLGTFIGSFQTRLLPFMLFYSLLAGFGTGLSYSTPMQAGWTWFPESKGLVTGLTLFGFGFGAFVFNKVGTNMFSAGTPWGPMIRKLVVVYTLISISGSALIKANPTVEVTQATSYPLDKEGDLDDQKTTTASLPPSASDPPATFQQAIRSKRFAILWFLGLCTFTPGLTVLGLYKRFAMGSGGPVAVDALASTIGGLGSIANGVGRVFWGNLVDKIGFQRGFNTTTTLTILLLLLLPWTTGSKFLFGGAICSTLFCLGGSIAMFVTCNAQTFGVKNAGEIYSVLFSSFALSSIFGAKLVMVLLTKIGWLGIFRLLAMMSTCSLGLLALLRVEQAKPAPWSEG